MTKTTSGPFHLMVRVLMRGERSPPHAEARVRTRRGLCRPATELRGFAPFAWDGIAWTIL